MVIVLDQETQRLSGWISYKILLYIAQMKGRKIERILKGRNLSNRNTGRDIEGPDFACVIKRLKDTNGLPIGTANENPILDTRVYEVEYIDGHKVSLTANSISQNMFALGPTV